MIIPFFIPHAGCPHRCVFCDQKRITGAVDGPDPASVPEKIRPRLETGRGKPPVHVAFYGGSFTALPLEQQERYLSAVRSYIESGRIEGIRISTRPDCIDRQVLILLKEYRVRVVELGAQSLDDEVLERSGRAHTAADTRNAVRLLREGGFTVGLQLMAGLPGDDADAFAETVRKTIELKPDFVRLYPLLVIKDTPLAELYRAGRYAPLTLDEAVTLCRDAVMRFEEAGIDVIRVGLQAAEELERPGTVLAGPWHPAFGQLVKSSLFLEKMRTALTLREDEGGAVRILINPADLSSAVGQRRSNIITLKKEYGFDAVRILPDKSVPAGAVRFIRESTLPLQKKKCFRMQVCWKPF